MITTNIPQVIELLREMAVRMAAPLPAFSAIGHAETAVIRTRIEEGKTTPEGQAWAPWRPWTADEREAKGNADQGLLWDTGTLLNSIRSHTEAKGVSIGTDVPYADELQGGRGGRHPMVARPFIGWDQAGIERAERTMISYLEGHGT